MSGYPQILVMGDSIAQLSFKAGGYGAALVDEYQGKVDVINRGMGGYNSRQLLLKVQSDLLRSAGYDIRLVLIHIGTNDSAVKGFQKVEVDEYTSNLHRTIEHVRTACPDAGIILLTPSTLDPPAADAWEDLLAVPASLRHPRIPENTLRYVKACKGVAMEQNVPVIDCFELHQAAVAGGVPLGDLFTDGLHYSAKGYSYINVEMFRLIKQHFPDLHAPTMPFGFPDFWMYGQAEDSPARLAADLYESIRTDALQRIRDEENKAARLAADPLAIDQVA